MGRDMKIQIQVEIAGDTLDECIALALAWYFSTFR